MEEKMIVLKYFVDSRVKDTSTSILHPFTMLQLAAALAFKSTHPLASSIIKEVEKNPKVRVKDIIKDFSEVQGIGMTGLIAKNSKQDTKFYLGHKQYVTNALKIPDSNIDSRVKEYERPNKTVLVFANQYRLLGYIIIGVSDSAITG